MSQIYSFIYPYEKRNKLREHPSFSQISALWEPFNKQENTGNLSYLLMQAVEEKKGIPLKLQEWVDFYFKSGEKRNLESKTVQNDTYCGRTIEELNNLAQQLKKAAWEKGFKLHDKGALNTVVIKVLDETYETFARMYRCIPALRTQYPNLAFEYASPYDSMNYDVDLMVKENDCIVYALQIVAPAFSFENKEKHELFKSIYDSPVKVVKVDINGKVINMPIL